jgi:hypothetical protein
MEPRHHGLEHQADVRPHPRLTRLRCGSSAGRPPRKRRYPAPSTAFCTQSNAQRRRNPPKSFAAIKRNTQSDRLLEETTQILGFGAEEKQRQAVAKFIIRLAQEDDGLDATALRDRAVAALGGVAYQEISANPQPSPIPSGIAE